MLRFASEPEGSANSLLPGTTKTVWVWLNFSMIFLSESASDEAMGHRAVVHSQGPYYVEMVGSSCPTRGWSLASLLGGLFQLSRSGDIGHG